MIETIDFKLLPENLDDKLEKLKQAVEYLITIDDPNEVICSHVAYDAINYIIQIITSKSFNEKYNNYVAFSQTKTACFFAKLLLHYSEIIDTLNFSSSKADLKNIDSSSSLDERKIKILNHITLIIGNLTSSNMFIFGFFNQFAFGFSIEFCYNNGLKALINFFTNKNFIKNKSEVTQFLIVLFLDIIKDLSSKQTGRKDLWIDLNVAEVLKNFKYRDSNDFIYKEILPIVDEIRYLIKFKPLSECLAYLNELKDPKLLIEDNEAFKIFYFIYNLLINNRTNKFELFIEHKCEELFFNLLQYFVSICDELDYSIEHVVYQKNFRNLSSKQKKKVERTFLDLPNLNLNLNERRIQLLGYLQLSLNRLLNNSIKFRLNCVKLDIYKYYLCFLSNHSFVKRIPSKLLKAFCVSLYNLSRYTIENKHIWISLNAIPILLNLADLFKDKIEIVESVYVIIPNIATDEQIESLPEIGSVVDGLMKELKIFEDSFKTHKKMIVIRRELLNDDNEIEESDFHIKQKFLTYLVQALQLLAINEKMKIKIFVEHQALETLKTIIFNGFWIEKRRTLRLLSQLCFDENILDIVAKDKELNDYLKQITDNKTMHKDVIKACKEAQWILTEYGQDEPEIKEATEENKKTEDEHIMISYNKNSREICLKIKEELERIGLKVWIDVTSIHGSSLDSMATAVENAYVVLMCVSENYRQSVNCQAEAQYAFKLKKPIIPLIMEEGYENVKGWLGMIMGDKIFVNFKKYSYDECLRRLKEEIRSYNVKSLNEKPNIEAQKIIKTVPELSTTTLTTTTTAESKNVKNWSNHDVLEWFRANKVNEIIIDAFKTYTGDDIEHLYKIKCEAPEFFYQMLSNETKNQLKMLDIVKLIELLEKACKIIKL